MNALTAYDKHLARLLMISFFLPLRLQVAVMIPVCAFFAIRDVITGERSRLKEYKWALLLSGIYLLHLIYLFITPKQYLPDLFTKLENSASLLLMPFIFLLLKKETKENIQGAFLWFVLGCILSCIAGNIFYLAHYGWETNIAGHVQYRLYFESITGVHPTYMGIYLCFSIAILLWNDVWKKNLRGWLIGVVYFVLFIFLLALFPKTPLIAVGALLAHFIWMRRKQGAVIFPLLGSILAAVIIASIFIPFSGQRLDELAALVQNKTGSNVIDNSINMRRLIWKIDLNLLKDHWLWGVGPGQLITVLTTQYFFYSMLLRYPLGVYDTHNQYINYWLCFGLIGILLFAVILIIHFRKSVLQKNYLYAYLLIVIYISFFTENVLSNQHGVVFYAFFTSLFFFSDKAEIVKNK